MARSSIERMDPRVRQAVDALVRGGHATIDEIVAHIATLGGEASRSAVGRYAKRMRERMEAFIEAQRMAEVWVGRLEEAPQSDVGQLLSQVLRTVAYQHMADLEPGLDGTSREIATLSRALKDLASADKASTERVLKVRREVLAQVVAEVEDSAHEHGLSNEVIDAIKTRILGVAA